MRTTITSPYLALVLLMAFVAPTFSLDSDFDTLPDDWELANGRDPLVPDYGMVYGEGWRCIKSDAGVSCVGAGYPAEPVFTPSIGDVNFSKAYEFVLDECSYSGTADYTVSIDSNDLYIEAQGLGSSECPVLTGHSIEGDDLYLNFSGVSQLYDGYYDFCALDNNGISCFIYDTVYSGTALGQDLYSIQWGFGYVYDTNGVLFDSDRDGIPNDIDPNRLVPADTDGDGIPNDEDGDDDNDGVQDVVDEAPLDQALSNEINLSLDKNYKGLRLRN